MQQSICEDFALGVAPSHPHDLIRYRFKVLYGTLIVAVCTCRERFDNSRHHLASRHLPLRQALPELGRQLCERLCIAHHSIGEGAVDISKRYARPREGARSKRGHCLVCTRRTLQTIEIMPPQQRSSITQRDERCPWTHLGVECLVIELEHVIGMTAG